MAGFVIGSPAHYGFLIERLLDVSDKLRTVDVSRAERKTLYELESIIIDQLIEHFPNGKPGDCTDSI